jgi:hypothetical protein
MHNLALIFFPSPKGRGSKVRDLIQRASFARDSRFCFSSDPTIEVVRSLFSTFYFSDGFHAQ